MILSLRVVPGFPVAVEERNRPQLRSRPLAVGDRQVRDANILAQRAGVRLGMTLAQARQHCPGILILPLDLPRYGLLWEEICDILRVYTPLVEPLEIGKAVCDLSGCERLWGGDVATARTIATHIHRQIGIVPWLGLASNRLVAELASTTVGDGGITLIPLGEERSFLAGLPLPSLPGVEARLALTFQVLGLQTIGQFAALPPAAVQERFGEAGKRLQRYARGIDPRPISPPPVRPSVTLRSDCEEGSIEDAVMVLHTLAERAAIEMEERNLAGKLFRLILVWEQEDTVRGGIPVLPDAAPMNTAPVLSSSDVKEGPMLPIASRIHSRLPIPNRQRTHLIPCSPDPLPVESVRLPSSGRTTTQQTLVRTPLHTAGALMEVGQRLLLQGWPRVSEGEGPRVQALEITVMEFEGPAQLSLLEGWGGDRFLAIARQEGVLTSRYGYSPFLHLAYLEPRSVLTERRFRWEPGLKHPQRRRGRR